MNIILKSGKYKIFSLLFFVLAIFFLNFNFVSAVQCASVNTYSCSMVDGRQDCTYDYVECQYGCELANTYLGNVCPNDGGTGADDCFSYQCMAAPIPGCTDVTASNYDAAAVEDDGSCIYAAAPSDPTITGSNSAQVDTNTSFDFNSTDPANYQIRYGIDWSIPADGVADEWVPAVGYVNSGVTQTATHSWNSIGDKNFKVLAQNEWGENSNWVIGDLTIYGGSPSLVVEEPTTVNGGATVHVGFSEVLDPAPMDWIGLYLSGGSDGSVVNDNWVYTSTCTKNAGINSESDGNCAFTMPNALGEYNFRLFSNNSWNKLETSNLVTVAESDAVTLVGTPDTVIAGQNVKVDFTNMLPPTDRDWIGLYSAGNLELSNELDYLYTSNCSQVIGGTPKASGFCNFNMPTAGEFRFIIYSDWESILTSNLINVNPAEEEGGGTEGDILTVTVTVGQSNGGKILSGDNVIDTSICTSPCVKTYPFGTDITLQAIPSSSYWKFNGWNVGGCSGTGSCRIVLTGNLEIDTSFSPRLFFYNEL